MRKLLFIAAATMLLAACNKEPGGRSGEKLVEFSVNLPNPAFQPFGNGTRFDGGTMAEAINGLDSSHKLYFIVQVWQEDNIIATVKQDVPVGQTSASIPLAVPAGTYDILFFATIYNSDYYNQNITSLKEVDMEPSHHTRKTGAMYAVALLGEVIGDGYSLPPVSLQRITARVDFVFTNLNSFPNYKSVFYYYTKHTYNIATGEIVRSEDGGYGYKYSDFDFGADNTQGELMYAYFLAAKDGTTQYNNGRVFISDSEDYNENLLAVAMISNIPLKQNEVSRVVTTFTPY